jgi:hypothetical protein
MKQKKALGKRAIAKTEEELYLKGSLTHIEELGELQNLFHAVEKKELQEPNLAQWERFGNRVMSRIRPVEKKIGHRVWLQTWKDKITATDSICLKLLIYLLLAITVAGVLLLGYVVYVMLSHQPLEQVAAHRAFLTLWPAYAAIPDIAVRLNGT